jgi:hypothetical protein
MPAGPPWPEASLGIDVWTSVLERARRLTEQAWSASGADGLAEPRSQRVVCEPVYYGPDTAAAYDFVASMRHTEELLATADAQTAERSRRRLRVALAEHDTGSCVYVGSQAWIITGRRG